MIPRTFPSSVASINGATQMIVYFLPSVTGLTRWVDYIPVQYSTVNTSTTENTYNQDGYIPVTSLSSITGMTPFKEYVPVYVDTAATDVWKVNITGFIPVGTAGIGGSALSLNFTGMSTLDSRITFSRTSNATLTGSDGLIQYAPHNLLTYSEQFDNAAWTKTAASISANTVLAPNGTTTADKAVENTALSTHGVSQTFTLVAGTTYSISVYAKAAERTCFTIGAGSLVYGFFNLSTGVATPGVGNANNIVISAVASDVGNGWYRCTVAITRLNTNLTTGPEILLSNTTTPATGSAVTYTGDGTSGIYIWGAQLNVGALQDYNSTTVKNLLGYTQEFDNAVWTKILTSVTANTATAPDGTETADTLTVSSSGAAYLYRVSAISSAGTYTLSLYVKPITSTAFGIYLSAGGGTTTYSLSGAGSVVSGQGTITALEKGWYRVSITGTTTGSGNAGVFLSAGVAGDSYYIWGAQLSDSASVDPYVYNPVAAPSAAAYYGPRFDYDPITLAPKGLLIEEQRTNLLTYSEQFDNAAWVKTNASISADVLVCPDGTLTADKLVEDTAVGTTHRAYQARTCSASTPYSYSVYAKAGERTRINLIETTLGGSIFDLSTGTVVLTAGGTAAIAPVGNGWYRCSIVVTTGGAQTSFVSQVQLVSGTSNSYTGDGVSGAYIWGAQLEAGAFATSYIPTVASQVTRSADVASINTLSPWYNATEGTLYAEADVLSVSSTNPHNIASLATASTNLMRFWIWEGAPTVARFTVINSTQQAEFTSGTLTADTVFKGAAAYKTDNFAGSFNGAAASTDTSATVPTGFSQLNLGSQTGVTGFMSGHIRRIAYYPRRLTNSELQALTA